MSRRIQDTDTGQHGPALVERLNLNVLALSEGEGSIAVTETVATTVAIAEDDEVVLVDATAGAVTLTLPACEDFTRRRIVVRHVAGSNNVTLNPQALEQIDSGSAGVGVSLNSIGDTAELVTAGVKWNRIR